MPRPHHCKPFGAIVLLSMVTMLSPACTSWHPIPLEAPAYPDRVRITTENLERVELRDAVLVGDTAIAGLSRGGNPRSVRLVDVRLLELGQIDPGRTIPLVVGIPLGLGFACAAGLICGGL
jgi:hypothetical protein